MDALAEYAASCFDAKALSRALACPELLHTQLQSGGFEARVSSTKQRDIQLLRTYYSQRILLQGPISSNRVAFLFLEDGQDTACVNGVQARAQDVVVWPEQVTCDAFLPGDCSFTLLLVPRKRLLLAGVPAKVFNRLQVLSGDGGRHQRLGRLCKEANPDALMNLELWREMLTPDYMVTRPPHCLEVQTILLSLQEEVQANLLKPWRVADLADMSTVSRRRLELMCRQYLELSPRQWVSALRLNAARCLLIEGSIKTTEVGEVAQQCGFTHMGRFAQAYRSMFAEYPSDTLRYGCNRS